MSTIRAATLAKAFGDGSMAESIAVTRVRRRNLSDEIVDQLLTLIASGALPDGRLPPERVLCGQLGVSRTSLREALAGLDCLGVIVTQGKAKHGRVDRARGQLMARTADNRQDIESVTAPLEARQMLEPEVAARAAECASAEALSETDGWFRLMSEAIDRDEPVIAYDMAFHVSIARATGNRTLVHLVTALTDAAWESRERSFRPRDAAEAALNGHALILEALRARDTEQARRAMRRHLDEVETLVRASLEKNEK